MTHGKFLSTENTEEWFVIQIGCNWFIGRFKGRGFFKKTEKFRYFNGWLWRVGKFFIGRSEGAQR